DNRGLHLLLLYQEFLGGVADRQRQRRGGQVAVEGVLVLLIVGVNALADLVRGRTRRDEGRLQARGLGLERQHHFADVACDDDVDLVFVDRALEGANGIGRRGVVVIG